MFVYQYISGDTVHESPATSLENAVSKAYGDYTNDLCEPLNILDASGIILVDPQGFRELFDIIEQEVRVINTARNIYTELQEVLRIPDTPHQESRCIGIIKSHIEPLVLNKHPTNDI